MLDRPADPGLNADLATLLPSECPNCGRMHPGHDFNTNPGPVQAELARLREERDRVGNAAREVVKDALLLKEAAVAECERLQQALRFCEQAAEELLELEEPAAEVADVASSSMRAILSTVREALAGPDTPADSQEDKT